MKKDSLNNLLVMGAALQGDLSGIRKRLKSKNSTGTFKSKSTLSGKELALRKKRRRATKKARKRNR